MWRSFSAKKCHVKKLTRKLKWWWCVSDNQIRTGLFVPLCSGFYNGKKLFQILPRNEVRERATNLEDSISQPRALSFERSRYPSLSLLLAVTCLDKSRRAGLFYCTRVILTRVRLPSRTRNIWPLDWWSNWKSVPGKLYGFWPLACFVAIKQRTRLKCWWNCPLVVVKLLARNCHSAVDGN